jgi:PAS domain S-box-containing protein
LDDKLQRRHTANALVGNVSRDLRTPLTLLLGPLQDLLDNPASALAPASRAALDNARRNAERLMQLLDTLPDLQAVDEGAGLGDRARFDLGAFTADLVEEFRATCEAVGLRLVVDCAPGSKHAAVDRDAWQKIVRNLVARAFQSTSEGLITVRVQTDDGDAELTVSDTGAPIPERELPYVFDRVEVAGSSGAEHARRTSVGLPFVRDLVRQRGGSIDVQSTPAVGTRFTVRLPLEVRGAVIADSGPRPAPALTETRGAAPAHARIVIAEDHDETREYLTHVLEGAGFTVDAFADGQAALESCARHPPDVLVSDVTMPALHGYELIDRLRKDGRTAVIPVLLLSARGGEESRIEGIAAGADDYLVKPLSRRELVARVDGALRLGRLRREMARRAHADLDSLFSMAPDGVIVVGPDGTILAANEQARHLFGYTMQEFVRLGVTAIMPESDSRASLVPPLREVRAIRGDGTEFSAEIARGPLQFKNQACTIAIVRDVTERKKLEAERAEQEHRFRDLSRRLVEVQETERRRLSTELHDRTSPELAAIQINMKMLADSLRGRDTEDIRALLDDTVHLIRATMVGIREISSNLRPSVLDDGGLIAAVRAYAQQFTHRTGIVVRLDTPDAAAAALPAEVQSSLFRIVQEALTNCAKHAHARTVTIRLTTSGGHLVSLAIADDGIGFEVDAQTARGLGLLTMRERAEFMGARFTLETSPGAGTRIQVVV